MNPNILIREHCVITQHNAEILVPWWSFTKTVIATAALVLVRDKLLALDNPLPNRNFTLRQLLRHQAGLADYGQLADYHAAVARRNQPWPAHEMLQRLDADRLRYTPGNGWNYSNVGYLYVRQLIEEITGEYFGDALQRLALQPLGITEARLASTPTDLINIEMGKTDYDPGWVYHGLIIGSLSDAAFFLYRLLTSNLLPAELLKTMQDCHALNFGPIPGRPWLSPAYGLGLMMGTFENGVASAGHTGSGPGSVIGVYHAIKSKQHLTAASFCLSEDQGVVERDVMQLLA